MTKYKTNEELENNPAVLLLGFLVTAAVVGALVWLNVEIWTDVWDKVF